jgi:rubrerythrin
METIKPDWAAFEAAREAQAEKEAHDELYREGMRSVPENSVQICTRCNGTGRVWQGGGASQERVSAPSGSNSSQQEDFYNSASSVRTNYSSGSMGICPVCNGTGRP